ncbi:hypothetical protein HAX54_042376, partial [Datura stramonium]|nr:hypothetical protein [Datura stramonium]
VEPVAYEDLQVYDCFWQGRACELVILAIVDAKSELAMTEVIEGPRVELSETVKWIICGEGGD